MSHAASPSVMRPSGVVRVCQEWGLSRSTCSHQQCRVARPPREPAKRGPKTSYTVEELTALIRAGLAASPCLGEGHRQGWARLRFQGSRPAKPRVLRLMRQAGLLASSRTQRVLRPQPHDGTLTTDQPKQMGGTDATSTATVDDGPVTGFVAVDPCTLEGVGIHAAKTATRFEALEPIRQGVRRQFGGVTAGVAAGLQIRHDHGSPSRSDDVHAERRVLGMTASPAVVRAPEGNGVAERFIRTLKEHLLWVRPFRTAEKLRVALQAWLGGRHGFRSPTQGRRDLLAAQEAAGKRRWSRQSG